MLTSLINTQIIDDEFYIINIKNITFIILLMYTKLISNLYFVSNCKHKRSLYYSTTEINTCTAQLCTKQNKFSILLDLLLIVFAHIDSKYWSPRILVTRGQHCIVHVHTNKFGHQRTALHRPWTTLLGRLYHTPNDNSRFDYILLFQMTVIWNTWQFVIFSNGS